MRAKSVFHFISENFKRQTIHFPCVIHLIDSIEISLLYAKPCGYDDKLINLKVRYWNGAITAMETFIQL